MDLLAALDTYFRGERAAGLAFVPVGFALIAFAFWCWRCEPGAFGLTLAISLGVLGLVGTIGGGGLAVKTDAQVRDLVERHASDPSAMATTELARMDRVNANWPRLKIGWVVIGVIAMALIMLGGREWTTGLGLTLILACAMLFFVDVFAERRAEPYTEALRHAAASAED